METTDRRGFFSDVARMGAVAGLGALCGQTMSCSGANASDPEPNAEDPQTIAWPLSYVPLEEEDVRKRGHEGYYGGGCCYGAFHAIVKALTDMAGSPFSLIPTDMMRYGAGGVAGFGSLCGALNGACAAINLVCDAGTAKKLIKELMSWYAATPLPTDAANNYGVNHEYYVDQLKSDAWIEQTVAGGNLCHMSVTNWCLATRFGSGAVERSERCGRLTGDVAARAVELLNQEFDGNFVAVTPLPSEATTCAGCHHPGEDYASGEFTKGSMDCGACHVDPVLDPHLGR